MILFKNPFSCYILFCLLIFFPPSPSVLSPGLTFSSVLIVSISFILSFQFFFFFLLQYFRPFVYLCACAIFFVSTECFLFFFLIFFSSVFIHFKSSILSKLNERVAYLYRTSPVNWFYRSFVCPHSLLS